jgi:DNA-binding response OmpR family regulator
MGTNRILIIEDDETIANLERAILEQEAYDIEIASNGFEGLKRIARQKYDVIISDFSMPRMKGDTFYSEVQKISQGLEKRIVFVTGYINEFIESTGNEYIVKPFSNKQFLEKIKAFINITCNQTKF